MASDSLFRQKAPGIMNRLRADFDLDVESAAAILGNLGHESGGFRQLQEMQPMVAGSAGGWGWAQWTGPRREQFEAYVRRNSYDPSSDTANYKWLYLELKGLEGSEGHAIPAVKNAVGLHDKVVAFELAFERAHKDHKGYDSRVTWANKALDAYRANPNGTIDIKDAPALAKDGEILDPIKNVPAGLLDGHQLIAVLLTILQRALSIPEIKAIVVPVLKQIPELKLEPVEPKPAPVVTPAKGEGVSVTRPSVWLSILGLGASLFGIDQGAIGGAFGMGVQPTPTGTLSVLAPIITGALGAAGGFGWIGPALKGARDIFGAVRQARQGKP